jgi:hypothetical protein
MRVLSITFVFAPITLAATTAFEDFHYSFGSAATGDARSPCPALNTLANHGILNRTGRSLSQDVIVNALASTYNVDKTMGKALASAAILQLGKGGLLDLDALSKHGVIEHDASLTRFDAIQGDNHSLQPSLLAAMLADTPGDSMTSADFAVTRQRREAESLKAGSPKLDLKTRTLAGGESALALQAMGSKGADGVLSAPKEKLKTWFGEEQLPAGYRPANAIGLVSTAKISSDITSDKKAEEKGKAPTKGVKPGKKHIFETLESAENFFNHVPMLREVMEEVF